MAGKCAKWDTAAGKTLWENGCRDAEIAKQVGTTKISVQSYRLKHWEKCAAAAPTKPTEMKPKAAPTVLPNATENKKEAGPSTAPQSGPEDNPESILILLRDALQGVRLADRKAREIENVLFGGAAETAEWEEEELCIRELATLLRGEIRELTERQEKILHEL